MSYTPHEWESGEVLTPAKLNTLTTAIGEMDMSYTPKTWHDGDILSAAEMNRIEEAVASGGGGGGGDVSTAEVTIIANSGTGGVALDGGISGMSEGFGFVKENDGYSFVVSAIGVAAGSSTVATAILLNQPFGFGAIYGVFGDNVEVTGSCEYNDGQLIVTGDCTITADPVS